MFPIAITPEHILSITHCFKGGGAKPPPAPKPPTTGQAFGAAQDRLSTLRKRKGFESTILTGGMGVGDETSIRKTLLGS